MTHPNKTLVTIHSEDSNYCTVRFAAGAAFYSRLMLFISDRDLRHNFSRRVRCLPARNNPVGARSYAAREQPNYLPAVIIPANSLSQEKRCLHSISL